MLAVQVQYWALQESKRHNLVTEQQGARNLEIAQFSANENARHNQATEDLGYKNLELGYAQLAETKRHNIAAEEIGVMQNVIASSNAETNRMNALTQARNVEIAQQNANINARNADINAFRATNDYTLGLINADLKQQQVDIQDRLADYTWYDVFHNKPISSGAASQSAQASMQNADTNAYNAETNRMNAETSKTAEQHHYEIDQGNLEQRKKELIEKSIFDLWHYYNDSVDTAMSAYETVTNADRRKGR